MRTPDLKLNNVYPRKVDLGFDLFCIINLLCWLIDSIQHCRHVCQYLRHILDLYANCVTRDNTCVNLRMPGKDTAYGPLLFVNEDPKEGGTTPHRRAIYQHVQLEYAKWKRVEGSRKKRSSGERYTREDDNETVNSSSQTSSVVCNMRTYYP